VSRVLIVEDDEDMVRLATHWLERAGYEVALAADGDKALKALAADPLQAP